MGIETALMVASTAVSAMGAMEAASAREREADYNRQVSEMKARDAINRGNIDAEQQRMKAAKVSGAQRAAMGASGAVVDSGSFADILVDTATMGEKDAQNIRTNAMREAWGYESQAESYKLQKQRARIEGEYAAMGTMLTSGSRIGSKMGWFNSSGSGAKMDWYS